MNDFVIPPGIGKQKERTYVYNEKIEFEGNKGALDCNFSIVIVLKMPPPVQNCVDSLFLNWIWFRNLNETLLLEFE